MGAETAGSGFGLVVAMFSQEGAIGAEGVMMASALTKTALLYADDVELVGFGGTLSGILGVAMATGPGRIPSGQEEKAQALLQR